MSNVKKIIEGLKCNIDENHFGFKNCLSCEYRKDIDHLQYVCDSDRCIADAIKVIKSLESIESNLHLCDSCAKIYPECDATKDGVVFGSGTGNDNIIGCTAYVNRWMPQNEPRVMTLDELSEKTDVYFESLVYDTVVPALSSGSYDDGTVGLMTLEEESLFYVDEADYGVKWRCWDKEPTDEQRLAVNWNGK